MRLFIAIDMPWMVQEEVKKIQNYLLDKNLFKGVYTDYRYVHLTLKFLGEVDKEYVPDLDAELKMIVFSSIQAHLGLVNVFKVHNLIKTVFVSIICPELSILAGRIDRAVSTWSKPEERVFVPHLTLARVKEVEDSRRLLREINHISVVPVSFTINHFVLRRSVLSADGPRYTDLAIYPSTIDKTS